MQNLFVQPSPMMASIEDVTGGGGAVLSVALNANLTSYDLAWVWSGDEPVYWYVETSIDGGANWVGWGPLDGTFRAQNMIWDVPGQQVWWRIRGVDSGLVETVPNSNNATTAPPPVDPLLPAPVATAEMLTDGSGNGRVWWDWAYADPATWLLEYSFDQANFYDYRTASGDQREITDLPAADMDGRLLFLTGLDANGVPVTHRSVDTGF